MVAAAVLSCTVRTFASFDLEVASIFEVPIAALFYEMLFNYSWGGQCCICLSSSRQILQTFESLV